MHAPPGRPGATQPVEPFCSCECDSSEAASTGSTTALGTTTGATPDRRRLRRPSSGGGNPGSPGYLGQGDASGSRSTAGPLASPAVADADGNSKLTGVVAPFSTPTIIWDRSGPFEEAIAPGAFSGVLTDDVVLLTNHDSATAAGIPLARTTAGTLRLWTGSRGLMFSATLDPDSPVARSVLSAVRRGDLCGCSFSFIVARGRGLLVPGRDAAHHHEDRSAPGRERGHLPGVHERDLRADGQAALARNWSGCGPGNNFLTHQEESGMTEKEALARQLIVAAERRKALMRKLKIQEYRQLFKNAVERR